jgi:hypothetical protein
MFNHHFSLLSSFVMEVGIVSLQQDRTSQFEGAKEKTLPLSEECHEYK